MHPIGAARPRWPIYLLRVATVLTGGWIVAATILLQSGFWLVTEAISASTDLPTTPLAWLGVALATGALTAVPAGAIAVIAAVAAPEAIGVRAAARAWLLAAPAAAVVGLTRAVPVQHNELTLFALAVSAAGLAWLIQRLRRAGARRAGSATAPRPASGAVALGFVAGLLALLPWLLVGALGGVLETVLAVAAAAAIGLLAAGILTRDFFAAFSRSRTWGVLVGGLAAGVTLLPIASGAGGSGVALAEMLILPPLGLAAAALATGATSLPHGRAASSATGSTARSGIGPGTITALVGTAAAGPLAFVDPEETSILLGLRDVGFWALLGALAGVALALLIGLGYGLLLAPGRWPRRWLAIGLAASVAVAGLGGYAGAGQPGLHGEKLFVVMADQADLSGLATITDRTARLRATYQQLVEHARRSQAPLRRALDRWHLSYTPYYLVNGVLVDGGPLVRQWLSHRSDVARVLLDEQLRPLPAPAPVERGSAAPPDGTPQWNVQLIGADRVWRDLGVTGAGIIVGSSDSGVDGTHPALADGFRGGGDSWYDPWGGTTTPVDHDGHGTHTLGSAVGRDGIGVAPGAQWIGCVNLARNLGSPSHYLDCLQFMLAPFPRGGDPWRDGRPERAPQVLTNSWGCPQIEGCDAQALRPAVDALRAAGIFVVVAAGNSGPRCGSVTDPPAPYPDAFTVGAVNRNRQVADFSSRGPTAAGLAKPDLVAPGVDVLSALPGDTYGKLSGTSMATPQVAGVVALMWSANPRLIGDIDTTTRILRRTAVPVAGASDTCGDTADVAGAGLVDAYAAVQAAQRAR